MTGRSHTIEIVAYDPAWPDQFRRERDRVALTLAPWLAGPIEHIGSTAVPGTPAKPVIDIMAPVRSLARSRPAIDALEANHGYTYWPYRAEVMHWFCKPSEFVRTHHLHLVPVESALFRERLFFRDALRREPELRDRYVALKRRLAAEHRHDREAYTEGKSAFVASVVSRMPGRGSSRGG